MSPEIQYCLQHSKKMIIDIDEDSDDSDKQNEAGEGDMAQDSQVAHLN